MLTLIIIPTLLILLGLIYACDTYRFLNVDPLAGQVVRLSYG